MARDKAFLDLLRARLGYAGGAALFFGCHFVVIGISMPYFNPWLKAQGLTVSDIAIIAALPSLMRIVVGPVVGFLADRHQAHRAILTACSYGWALAWMLMALAQGFWATLAAQFLVALTAAAIMPLIETITVAGVRSQGVDYGRVRVWGSITFIAASVLAGWLVDWRGIDTTIALLVGGAIVAAVSTIFLPTNSGKLAHRPEVRLADAAALAASPTFLLFLAAVGMAQSSHATLYVFGTLHWQSLGISSGWCGTLWAISVIAEIILFWGAGSYARNLGPMRLMALGAVAALIRWLAMGLDPPLPALIGLQILHGLTYAALHLGAIQFMGHVVPAAQAGTAQSLYAFVTSGLGMVIATQLAAIAYLAHGGRAYWVMAAIAGGALIALIGLARQLRRTGSAL